MRLHRFFFGFDLQQKIIEIIDKDLIKQIKNVLRLRVKDEFILFDGKFNEAKVRIEKIKKERIEVSILETFKNKNELLYPWQVNLYCAILKKNNFEWAIQKAVEAGVNRIFPIITKRTIRTSFRKQRLEKIIKEAAEQSGRGIIPQISEPLDFFQALKLSEKAELNILFDPTGEKINRYFDFVVRDQINIFIGPEGGFEKRETELAKEFGFKILNLGPFILRSESAVLVSCYLAKNCFLRF
jgi:16S rRNA (uracil1498-N3)-methyltransferase